MATIQAKLKFPARKKSISSSAKKICKEKENCNDGSKLLRSPLQSPTKLDDSKRDREFLLRVNSPVKRKCNGDINSISFGCVSPAKRLTPSSLLRQLTLDSPSSKISPSSRKELFPPGNGKNNIKNAVRALHSTAPTCLPCRDEQISELNKFVESHLNNETSGTIYISGPPGTGKTASLNLILSNSKILSKCKVICINCTSIKSSTTLYSRISEELNIKVAPKTEKKYLSAIEKYVTTCQKTILLVLDELDQLESRKQSVLYTVFEWPSLKNSRIILVGIANALDLTDRVLPRLQAKLKLKPQLLHFPPYTRQQIVEIITERLTEAGVDKIFPQSALQLLASKVAAVSGDVRRALDMARRVIEISSDHSFSSLKLGESESDKEAVISVKQVMDVVSNVYGTTQTFSKNEDEESSDSFPLQQKLLICSVLLHLKRGKLKDITVGKLHEVYCKICEKRNLVAVDISEFISLASLVETRGILRVQGKIKNRLSKISLQWDEKEMVTALQDKKLLAAILEDKSFGH